MDEIDEERRKANVCLDISRDVRLESDKRAYWREQYEARITRIGGMLTTYHELHPTNPHDGLNTNPEE